jgi:hypothetical protein
MSAPSVGNDVMIDDNFVKYFTRAKAFSLCLHITHA